MIIDAINFSDALNTKTKVCNDYLFRYQLMKIAGILPTVKIHKPHKIIVQESGIIILHNN